LMKVTRRDILKWGGMFGVGVLGAGFYDGAKDLISSPDSSIPFYPNFSVEVYGPERLEKNPFKGHAFSNKKMELARKGGFLSIRIGGWEEYEANVYETKEGFRELIAKNVCDGEYYDDLLLPRPIGERTYDFVITSPQIGGTKKLTYEIDFKTDPELLALLEKENGSQQGPRKTRWIVQEEGDPVKYLVRGLESLTGE